MDSDNDRLRQLTHQRNAGTRHKYVFFWGHQPRKDGALSPSCFSQWWPSPFEVDGDRYATAEHYMMAEKARLFGDAEVRAKILKTRHPKAVKALGRKVRGFNNEVWTANRYRIVVAGNMAKFGQDPALKAFLLGTGKRVLVEASPVDRIWGIGLKADDDAAQDPNRWRGLNLLGFALMDVRDALASA